jgi:hypothetical protein
MVAPDRKGHHLEVAEAAVAALVAEVAEAETAVQPDQ